MTTGNETRSCRHHEFVTQPRKLVPAYALLSDAPRVVAARLGIDLSRLAIAQNLNLEQVEALERRDLLAQVIESLVVGTLREILRWEKKAGPNSQAGCLPFVDVALDALAQSALEITASGPQALFPSAAQVNTAFREATRGGDDRSIIRTYYWHYINRLLLFSLTGIADRNFGPGRYFKSLAQRNIYYFSMIYSCKSAISRLPIPPAKQPLCENPLEAAVARAGEVSEMVGSLPFVSRSPFPRLRRRTVLCGKETLRNRSTGQQDTIYLSGDSPDRNVFFRCDRIEDGIGALLSSMSRDLVEVAAFLFTGDVLVRRTARWRRLIDFVIPVRNPERWNSVAEDLGMMTSFLSGDHISFEFVEKKCDLRERVFNREPAPGDCVCLLSGGLDSFAGALTLLQDGRLPLFVGHFQQNHVARRQRLAVEALRSCAVGGNRNAAKQLAALRLDVGLAPGREKHGFTGKLENTQRLRSFLFLSLATAVADGLGLREVFIPENGIISLNVPLAACRTGSRSSRSTHPRFLWYYEKIVNRLYGSVFRVRNPLVFKTKAEILEVLKGTGAEEELPNLVSCIRYSYGVMMDKRRGTRSCTHCGTCFACLIRRAAMIKAGLGNHDAAYVVQPFEELSILKDEERLDLLHLVEFCKIIHETRDEHDLLIRHPQLFLPNQYFPGTAGASVAALELARMYRRFAGEIMTVVKETVKEEAGWPLLKICNIP